jgi:type IV pilus assembly protein PilX
MKINQNRTGCSHTTQQGAALVIAMILLTIITLLSISAMRNTSLETKIAVNHQFKELSFQAAESALAKATVPETDVVVPPSVPGDTADNDEYFDSNNENPGQTPRLVADLVMEYLYGLAPDEIPDPSLGEVNVIVSGYPPNSGFHAYMATATGHVGQSSTKTVNRSQVILFTD